MAFTSNLTEIMRKLEVTYEELQFRAKVAPDTIARCSDSRIATCKLETLGKIALALGVDVKDLYTFHPIQQS